MPAGIDRRWLHDLRNAVNTASVASAVVRRMLETDMDAGAVDMLADLERACARCHSLLAAQPAAGEGPARAL